MDYRSTTTRRFIDLACFARLESRPTRLNLVAERRFIWRKMAAQNGALLRAARQAISSDDTFRRVACDRRQSLNVNFYLQRYVHPIL